MSPVLGLALFGAAILILAYYLRRERPQTKEHLEITPEFTRVLETLNSSTTSVLVAGKAGTGKSTLLRLFLERTRKRCVVLAPTGVAALNVKGQTIHSFFRFPVKRRAEVGVRTLLDTEDIKFDAVRGNLYRALDVLVIDEISMVRADLIRAIDLTLRKHCDPERPFGGVQMAFFGDLFQLPPVVLKHEWPAFEQVFGGPYFFDALTGEFRFECVELTRVFRQSEASFLGILNRIRTAEVTNNDFIDLHARHVDLAGDPPEDAIVLTTTNAIARAVNRRIEDLPGEPVTCTASLSGTFEARYERIVSQAAGDLARVEDAVTKQFPTSVDLMLKKDARVMLLRNDSQKRWANGSLGTVVDVAKDRVSVRLDEDSKTWPIEREKWEEIEYRYNPESESIEKVVKGAFIQFPLRLAWGITIHKAQGKTLEKATIDLGSGAFAPGQAYVALSRCRSLGGLWLKSQVKHSDVFVDPRVVEFANSHCGGAGTDVVPPSTGEHQGESNDNFGDGSLDAWQGRPKAKLDQEVRDSPIVQECLACRDEGATLEIEYRSWNDSASSTRVIEPLDLYSKDGRAYVSAYCHLRDDERTFRIDRVVRYRREGGPWTDNPLTGGAS